MADCSIGEGSDAAIVSAGTESCLTDAALKMLS